MLMHARPMYQGNQVHDNLFVQACCWVSCMHYYLLVHEAAVQLSLEGAGGVGLCTYLEDRSAGKLLVSLSTWDMNVSCVGKRHAEQACN